MKNKAVIGTLVILALMVVGSIFYNLGQSTANSEQDKKEKVKVGVLQFVTHDALDAINDGISKGLEESGYDKDSVEIDYVNAEADQSKIQTMSKQLVANRNDVLVGIATPAAQGLANATKDIPVVMGAISDPVGAKLVSDLKHPSANITGVSNQVPVAQEVDLITKLTPDAKTIGVLYASSEDNSQSQVDKFEKLAKEKGLTVKTYAVPSTNEITATMSVMTGKVDAIFVPQDNTIASAMKTVAASANKAKLPVYVVDDSMVKNGGFAAVGQNQFDLGVETGKMVAQILDGKAVKDMPVNVIDTGIPTLNMKVAKELGINIPKEIMDKAKISVNVDQ
ncbi:tryptophan ABC transporter substrate-binding protein [Streptococcus thoraltensis]|uniref:tryptophan ABC transporter substrate-binding protein n=1 Tax=Streptococcus thoraltensis TaxID=55085 RepID=UPI0003662ABF|nr:tryptophan ABC transporter substrate-binding protein [Streptococcus thoraltensis]MDY4760627.1 tryptophan ABC transporter substrate-binding protein [Streptococcus thoraltensis]